MYDKSIEYLNKAVKGFEDLNNTSQKIVSMSLLSNIYYRKGNYKKSCELQFELKQLTDSIQQYQNSSLGEFYEMQNSYNQKRNELLIENQNEKLNSANKNIFILVLTCLIFAVIGIFLYISKIKKQKYLQGIIENEALQREVELKDKDLELKNKDLELNNKELALSIMNRIKLNGLTDNIIEKLEDLKEDLSKIAKLKISGVINDISKSKDDGVWEDFEMRFKRVYNDFYDKLLNICPDLTPTEIKLCAFLKLNMTSKEISSILNISNGSIVVERARIRKKLGLTNQNINLVNYLMDL